MQRASHLWLCVLFAGVFAVVSSGLNAGEDMPADPAGLDAPAEDAGPPPVPPPPPIPDEVDVPPPPPEGDDDDAALPDAGAPLAEGVDGSSGTVTAPRVNVRAGPSTRYEIVVTLNNNTNVTVHAKSGDWLKIGYPEGEYCYIHPRHLQGDIPPDIPDSGLVRAVQSEEAPIRVRNWERSSVVGTVQRDDLVTLVGMRGQWAKILPPPTAYAWIFGKYVSHEGQLAQEGAPQPAEGTAVAQVDENGDAQDPLKKPVMSEEQRKRIRERYKIIEEQVARQESERRNRIDDIMGDLDAELERIQAEIKAKKAAAKGAYPSVLPTPPTTPDQVGGFTGWLEYIGRAGRRPAAFRLVKGGEILFLVRSPHIDLIEFVNRRVLVNGEVELAPGFEANVLIVDTVQMLDTGPVSVQEKPEVRRPYQSPARPDLPVPPAAEPADEELPVLETGEPSGEEGDIEVIEVESSEPVVIETDIGDDDDDMPVVIEAGEGEVEIPARPEDSPPVVIEAGTDTIEIAEPEEEVVEEPAAEADGATVSEPEPAAEDTSDLPPPPALPTTIGAGDGETVEKMAEEIGKAATVIDDEE